MNNIFVNAQSSIKLILSKIIYFDPYLIDDYVNDADYIFITHNHYDHFSINDIEKVMNDKTIIIAPLSMKDDFSPLSYNVFFVEPDNSYNVFGVSFDTVVAYNINKSYHKKSDNFVGYVVSVDGNRYYIAGDTDALEELYSIKCDYAFLPIGGTYTMDWQEACDLVRKIMPKYVIPTHYKTIVGSDDDAYNFKKIIGDLSFVYILF